MCCSWCKFCPLTWIKEFNIPCTESALELPALLPRPVDNSSWVIKMLHTGIAQTSSRSFRLLSLFHFSQRVLSIGLITWINIHLVVWATVYNSLLFWRFVASLALSFLSFLLLMKPFRTVYGVVQTLSHQFATIFSLACDFFSFGGVYCLWCLVIKGIARLWWLVCFILRGVITSWFVPALFRRHWQHC